VLVQCHATFSHLLAVSLEISGHGLKEYSLFQVQHRKLERPILGAESNMFGLHQLLCLSLWRTVNIPNRSKHGSGYNKDLPPIPVDPWNSCNSSIVRNVAHTEVRGEEVFLGTEGRAMVRHR
jgi:hypothetical protein